VTSAVDSGSVYAASPTSIAQVPFSQPRSSVSSPVTKGQKVTSADARTATERRPVANSAQYADATTVTAFAASESATATTYAPS
jgi:hypothetical protein